MLPSREPYWNISSVEEWLGVLLWIIAFGIIFYGLYLRFRLWRLGKSEERAGDWSKRLWSLAVHGFGQLRVVRDTYPGVMHLFIFWGTVMLFIASMVAAVPHIASWVDIVVRVPSLLLTFWEGDFYLWYSMLTDVIGLLFVIGALMAMFRRYVLRPERLDSLLDDGAALVLIVTVGFTGFFTEGFRIAATEAAEHPDWAVWSPVGYAVASPLSGLDLGVLLGLHKGAWWTHVMLTLGLASYVVWSKLLHMFVSPANIFLQSFDPKGALKPILDLENAESFGVANIQEFTWKQLLDLDACMRCGRCQDSCPAYLSNKPLSPKKLIQGLRAVLNERGPLLLKGNGVENAGNSKDMIKDVITEDVIWSCTTC
ncbi:MAG: (Fe-S)-binding protein, partial [Chloroflexota bacterium]